MFVDLDEPKSLALANVSNYNHTQPISGTDVLRHARKRAIILCDWKPSNPEFDPAAQIPVTKKILTQIYEVLQTTVYPGTTVSETSTKKI